MDREHQQQQSLYIPQIPFSEIKFSPIFSPFDNKDWQNLQNDKEEQENQSNHQILPNDYGDPMEVLMKNPTKQSIQPIQVYSTQKLSIKPIIESLYANRKSKIQYIKDTQKTNSIKAQTTKQLNNASTTIQKSNQQPNLTKNSNSIKIINNKRKITKIQLRKQFEKNKYQKVKNKTQMKTLLSILNTHLKKHLESKDSVQMADLINTQFKTIEEFKHYFGSDLINPDENYMQLRRRARNFFKSSQVTRMGNLFSHKLKLLKRMNKKLEQLISDITREF